MPEAAHLPLAPLLERVCADESVKRLLALGADETVVDIAAAAGLRAPLIAATLNAASTAPLLVVTATGREADDMATALRNFVDYDDVAEFPSWETLPHERMSPRSDTVGRRLAVLRRLRHPEAGGTYGPVRVVVASVRALMQPMAKGLGDLEPVSLAAGDERPLEDIVEALVAAAYTRVDMVERRGEFAVRGGILDVFPPTEDHPVRLEFWGDTVEEIRWFKVADQRSLEVNPHGLWAPPCRELLLTPQVRERAAELAPSLLGVADMLTKVSEGIAVEGMESLMPALLPAGMETLVDVLPDGARVVLVDPERVRTRAHDLVSTSQEFLEASWTNAAAGNAVPVDLRGVLDGASYRSLLELREHAIDRGQTDVRALVQQHAKHVFSRHVALCAGLKDLQDLQTRQGGFEACAFQFINIFHVGISWWTQGTCARPVQTEPGRAQSPDQPQHPPDGGPSGTHSSYTLSYVPQGKTQRK